MYRAGLLGDNHVIFLRRFSGSAESPDGKSWRVRWVADSGSLEVIDPGSSARTKSEIQATMLGPKQLDVSRFPKITVDSESFKPGPAPGTWMMSSWLTLHGVRRQVEFLISWRQKGSQLRVSGRKELYLRDFQIKPIRVALGAIRVKNQFEVDFDIALDRERPGAAAHAAP